MPSHHAHLLLATLTAALLASACATDCSGAQWPVIELAVVDAQGNAVHPDALQVQMPGVDAPRDLDTACTRGQSDVCTILDEGAGPGTYTVFVQVGDQSLQRDVQVTDTTDDGCRLALQRVTLTLE